MGRQEYRHFLSWNTGVKHETQRRATSAHWKNDNATACSVNQNVSLPWHSEGLVRPWATGPLIRMRRTWSRLDPVGVHRRRIQHKPRFPTEQSLDMYSNLDVKHIITVSISSESASNALTCILIIQRSMLVTGPLHHFLHEDSDDNIPTVDRLTRWHTYETRLVYYRL